MKKKFIDPNTVASVEGGIRLSHVKWFDIKNIYSISMEGRRRLRKIFSIEKECLFFGSVEPAVVVSVKPLLVSVYSEDMDAVLLLQFAPAYAEKYSLNVGSRLISVNTYGNDRALSNDIFVGERYSGDWTDFTPHVADFLSRDSKKIQAHKRSIPEERWAYVKTLGDKYLAEHAELARNGFWFIKKRL
ncbi:MAG: hypothetical protein IJ309_07380 [Clostridia bacterium]|nr:hypothetical protein [Clostridia bacterium]